MRQKYQPARRSASRSQGRTKLRICILVPTFQRNDTLQRVVDQCRGLIQGYRGNNTYSLCITDSDKANPVARNMAAQYFVNPGTGFDDNLYFFWQNNLGSFDYVFTISDDDVFSDCLNPFSLMDAAIGTGAEVFMFNHRDFRLKLDGAVELGKVLYWDVKMLYDQTLLLRTVLDVLPRHIGILYSTKLLKEILPKVSLFRGTLHLYAAPVIFAGLKGTLRYSDYPLCLYNMREKTDGAWSVGADVLNGLAAFLLLLKQFLPAELYAVAERGFFTNYLGTGCWLRNMIAPSQSVMSEGEIWDLLAKADGIPDSLNPEVPYPTDKPVQAVQASRSEDEPERERKVARNEPVAEGPSFTIVVPTRDDPAKCRQILEWLSADAVLFEHPLRVVFLVNDTAAGLSGNLAEAVSNEQFRSLCPRLLHAETNHLTVEENILHTLGKNLDAVDEHFIIIGNSDRLMMNVLKKAVEYMRGHSLDLLIIGMMNCEAHEGNAVRQLYLTPRHLSPKNRLAAGRHHGKGVFANAMSDYGPEGILSYIGCQIYRKSFFKDFCAVLSELPEPLYGIPLAVLELTTRQECEVGFWPDPTVIRVDHLLFGADSARQPPNFWIPLSRTKRGLSRHCVLSILCNSLHLSPEAFSTLVNCQDVCNKRATSHLIFTNFLYSFAEQVRNIYQNSPNVLEWRYTPGELEAIVRFGERLETVDIGLSAEQRSLVSKWFQAFAVIGDYSDPTKIGHLMSAAPLVLTLLDARPGMDRWIAQQNAFSLPVLSSQGESCLTDEVTARADENNESRREVVAR